MSGAVELDERSVATVALRLDAYVLFAQDNPEPLEDELTVFKAGFAAGSRASAAKAWDEGHRHRWRRDPDDGCMCGAWASIECACGKYGSGELLSLSDNPYRGDA